MSFERMSFDRVFAFSDLHVHDFVRERDKFAHEVITDRLAWCDVAIVVGDHWEKNSMSYQALSNSPWADHFPAMRNKLFKLIGNHDTEEDYRGVPPFWRSIGRRLRLRSGGVPFVFSHGHEFDSASGIDKLMAYKFVRKTMPYVKRFERYLLGDASKPGRLARYYEPWNDEQKLGFQSIQIRRGEWGVGAHTHLGAIDYTQLYANTGQFPFTFIEIYRGAPRLVRTDTGSVVPPFSI